MDAPSSAAARKVAALERALAGLDGWITGLRREQSPTRAQAPKLSSGTPRTLWKANPLADWDEPDCVAYIAEHDLPYNPLHDRGYASIGCAPCTLPGTGREGRWAGLEKTECGLHSPVPPPGPPALSAVALRRAPHDALARTLLTTLEAEAVHVMREVAAELRAAGAAVQRRQGLDRAAAAG